VDRTVLVTGRRCLASG